MAIFKRVIPKDVQVLQFPDVSDARWFGVVNIESGSIKISTEIPISPSEGGTAQEFKIRTGDGDGDYPVFILDESDWLDDPNPMRQGWGVCIPFYEKSTELAERTLIVEDDDSKSVTSYMLGYLPGQEEQLNSGSEVSYIGDIEISDRIYVSDDAAYRGSHHAIVDCPLPQGTYRIYLIEGPARRELTERVGEVYEVVRALILIHEDKVGKRNGRAFPRNHGKIAELDQRLRDKDVVGKVVAFPGALNAVTRSFWISRWSQRNLHAYSWILHGLTFDRGHRAAFEHLYREINPSWSEDEELINLCVELRGLNRRDIVFPS